MDAEERKILTTFVGKKLVAFSQDKNTGDFDTGHWEDDEPLLLTFDDGSVLGVSPGGWHGSGCLYVTSTTSDSEAVATEDLVS